GDEVNKSVVYFEEPILLNASRVLPQRRVGRNESRDQHERDDSEKHKISAIHHLLSSKLLRRLARMTSCSRSRSTTRRSISLSLSLRRLVHSRCVYQTKKTRKRISRTAKGPYFSPTS